MRYVGSAPTSFGEDRKKYVVGSGGVNAGDTVFNVSYDEGKVDAYLNGIRLFPDTDFTKTASGVGSNITLASGVVAGDVLELFGLQGVHGGNGLVEDRFVVGTGSTGSGGSYTNSTTVFPTASNVGDTVSVWRNGVKLVHTTDYTVQPTASTVTLGSAAATADEICIQVVGIVTSANFIPKTGGTFTGEVEVPTLKLSSNVIKASDGGSTITLDTSDNVTIAGGLTVTQDFTVNGTTTTVNTTNTVVEDSLIGLNNGATSNTNDCGLIIERGSTGNDALIMWDESEDKWTLGTSTSTASSTGNLNITVGTLVANLEGDADVSGGTLTTSTAQKTAIVDGGKGNLTKSDVGLSNVTNDAQVPASTGGTFSGNVDFSNTSDAIVTIKSDEANSAGNTDVQLKLRLDGADKYTIGVDDDDSDKLKVFTGGGFGGSGITMDSSGNVGIGTSPSSPLHINNAASSACRLFLQNTGNTSAGYTQIWSQNNDLAFNAGNSERLRIDSSGNVEVNTGNLVFGGAGKGIDFSDSQTHSTSYTPSSEVLSHYEEGLWTPTNYTGGSVLGARYTKIGRLVTVTAYFANVTFSGTTIGGLPFSSLSYGVGSIAYSNSSNLDGITTTLSNIQFRQNNASVTPNGSYLMVSVTYQT